MTHQPTPAVLRHLERATAEHPLDRKLLVCSSMGEGRELLRALARRGRSWLGWEITTPKRLAMELVAPALAEAGLGVADPYEEQAAVDVALDEALADGGLSSLRELGESPGFRQAVLNAVEALRLAGVDTGRLRATRASNPSIRDLLARVLAGYTARLEATGRVDTADVLGRAVAMLTAAGGEGADAETWRTYLVPGLSLRGATGRLAETLLDAGARALESDPVDGVEAPPVVWRPDPESAPLTGLLAGRSTPPGTDLSLFSASGPAEEIREVLRRVMDAGLRWDEVEIVATDPVVYGGALHVVAERLGIPVSYAVGLPVERTRAGRATAAWFRWIQGDYPADEIRRLLESGDLRTPDGVSGLALARRLRRLRIGWGHYRYIPAIDRALASLDRAGPRRYESEEAAADRVQRERQELKGLRSLLSPILDATPRLDPGDADRELSPAALASGLHAFLERVAAADAPSATARERLLGIAARIAASLTRPTRPAAAIALLRRHLEIRVPAPQREGAAPWVSVGGHLHLSDVEHGGYTARAATFVVGLDADRFPGAGLQDPLLLDAQRRDLDPRALPTSSDRLMARRFDLAACLARLRGRVTLSYSAWDPTEARAVAPSAVMLQAFRATTGRSDASFEDLREGLGEAASAVPRTAAIDATDLWFRVLERDGVLRDGAAAVRGAFPGLDAGLTAGAALAGEQVDAYHGLIRPRPEALDPRRNADLVLSASGLEDLGTCGLRYFYKYALGVRKPDDPDPDPDVWLNALDRGRLLHAVYEAALRGAREVGIPVDDPGFMGVALGALDREARWMARDVPPPGEAIRRAQMAELRADVRSFVRMMAGAGDSWQELELKFGLHGEPPAPLSLRGGTVRLRGAIDRVDRRPDGLVVVDYKTGGSDRFERRHGTFNGGRRLQNVVYAAVAESLLDAPVTRMEYHFPTRKGRNEVIGYRQDEVRRGLGLIDRLLDAVAAGRFLATEDGADCGFCDYAPICRHRVEGWPTETPRADWAKGRLQGTPEFRERREVRVWEETFLAELEADAETD
jgi:ATP-dependent helicase/nuclease subunit B